MLSLRRHQPVWLLALGLVMVWSVGLAYGAVFSTLVGQVIGISGTVAIAAWWHAKRADLRVTDEGIFVGKNFVEFQYVGQVAAFDAQDFALAVRRKSTAYLSLLGRLDGGLYIEIADIRDPHECWLISLRDPQAAVTAIDNARRPNS